MKTHAEHKWLLLLKFYTIMKPLIVFLSRINCFLYEYSRECKVKYDAKWSETETFLWPTSSSISKMWNNIHTECHCLWFYGEMSTSVIFECIGLSIVKKLSFLPVRWSLIKLLVTRYFRLLGQRKISMLSPTF